MVKIFYDVETTGVNPKKHSIHQLSGCVEVDGDIVETFDYKVRPHPLAEYVPEALAICKVTREELEKYPAMQEAYKSFTLLLSRYVDKYDAKSKAWLVGYNNRAFDDIFLRVFFEQNKDQYFMSWFWSDSLDVMVLASQYLLSRRANMPSFKLHRVAKEVGLVISDENLHNSAYDVKITRDVYRIVTGLEVEL